MSPEDAAARAAQEGALQASKASAMEIFLDSANLTEIRKWLNERILDGATTNPSFMPTGLMIADTLRRDGHTARTDRGAVTT